MRLGGVSSPTAAVLGLACGLAMVCAVTAGCGAGAGTRAAATRPAGHAATAGVRRFCADEVTAPTPSEEAAIDRYWTPLARSAIALVSRGKMTVSVPKQHLRPAQELALQRLEWAERTFTPKPRLVCEQLPGGGTATGSSPAPSR